MERGRSRGELANVYPRLFLRNARQNARLRRNTPLCCALEVGCAIGWQTALASCMIHGAMTMPVPPDGTDRIEGTRMADVSDRWCLRARHFSRVSGRLATVLSVLAISLSLCLAGASAAAPRRLRRARPLRSADPNQRSPNQRSPNRRNRQQSVRRVRARRQADPAAGW